MNYRGTTIEDTTCECTDLYIARVLLTAMTELVARHEAAYLCGWSVITAVPIQCCVEGTVPASETPDGRPGVLLQLNAPTPVGLEPFRDALLERLYILPHLPTCSLFDATPRGTAHDQAAVAAHVCRWGDGFERPVTIGGRDCMRLPIMTGDQIIEKQVGICTGTDGVLEVFGETVESCMAGAQEAASRIVEQTSYVSVFNYPIGGISGAKVGGTTYTEEGVTINEPFCPSLRNDVQTKLPAGAHAVIEFPLAAMSDAAIRIGMKTAIDAFVDTPGIIEITAPSFDGAWGGRQLPLRDLVEGTG